MGTLMGTAPVSDVRIKETRDIGRLLEWRREVIASVFGVEPSDALMEENEKYYRRHVPDGTHLAFVAEHDGEECGCGAVCLTDELPSPDNPSGRCAYIMNIYVRVPWRRRGTAHALVGRLLEEARRRGCGKIYLETTADGKPVYTSLGFKEMPDMMKYDDDDET